MSKMEDWSKAGQRLVNDIYETAHREGEDCERASWQAALEDCLPDGVEFSVGAVVELIEGQRAALEACPLEHRPQI